MTPAPARLTAGTCPRDIAARIHVTVDGDTLRHVVAYDIEAGWIDHIEHDEAGFLVHQDGDWSVVRRHGTVQAMLRPEQPESGP